jgi:hypothetical protein
MRQLLRAAYLDIHYGSSPFTLYAFSRHVYTRERHLVLADYPSQRPANAKTEPRLSRDL